LVDAAATVGDPVAKDILARCGKQLAALVAHVFGICFERGATPVVSYVGGVFQSALLTAALKQAVRDELQCNATAPLFAPAGGAVLMALRSVGCTVTLSQMPAAMKS
jgi:N-acetylglucosamine kinase-like BadF-type ATPase